VTELYSALANAPNEAFAGKVFAHSGNDHALTDVRLVQDPCARTWGRGSARGALTCCYFPKQAGGRKARCQKASGRQVAG